MGDGEDKSWYKRKDIQTVCLSFLFVALILIIESVSLYNSYRVNLDLFQKNMDEMSVQIYKTDLASRFHYSVDNNEFGLKYMSVNRSRSDFDSINIHTFKIYVEQEDCIIPSINSTIEGYLSETSFVNLDKLDSVAHSVFVEKGVGLGFYSEIINPKTNEVIETTKPPTRHFSNVAESKVIPLNNDETKCLRFVLINPMNTFYTKAGFKMAFLLAFLIILAVVIYYQSKTICNQRKIVNLKNDLFAEISHEMKKPLSVMSMIVSSFEEETILRDEKRRARCIQMAKNEIGKMSNQAEVALGLAKKENGVFEINYEEFDLLEMVSAVADKYTYVSNKEVNIQIVDELESFLFYADPSHIEYLLENLITNSIKYSYDSVSIVVKLYEKEGEFCISVKDDGIGITEEEQRNIFDRYYRAEKMSDVQGHGIGLSYVERIVKVYGGQIELYSKPDLGSEFVIRLPKYHDVVRS